MKSSTIIMPAFAAIALAQYSGNATTNGTASTSYTTITAYTDLCTAGKDGITSTSTQTITSNVCAICTGGVAPSSFDGVLTTHTVVYNNVCPTGSTLTPATYTVTEPCPSGLSSGAPMPSTHVPAGFTTSVAQCACEGGSATLTVPAPTAAPATPSPAAPADTTATVAVELAHNSTAPVAGNNTGPVPTAPIQPGAASRSSLSVCSALMAAVVAMVYAL